MSRRLENRKPEHPKWCERCGRRRAAVGVGLDPEWLCLECFDVECQEISAGVRAGLESIGEALEP